MTPAAVAALVVETLGLGLEALERVFRAHPELRDAPPAPADLAIDARIDARLRERAAHDAAALAVARGILLADPATVPDLRADLAAVLLQTPAPVVAPALEPPAPVVAPALEPPAPVALEPLEPESRIVGQSGTLWMPARHYSPRRATRRAILWVVLHATQTHSRPGAARALGRRWSLPDSPEVSTHYVVDAHESVQCVDERDEAWAARCGNPNGIHVELVGRTVPYVGPLGDEPATQWDAPGWGLDVLRRAAALVRGICDRHSVPLERRSAAGVLELLPGIVTHATISAASQLARQKGRRYAPWWDARHGWLISDHGDPGGVGDVAWPWPLFLSLVGA